MTEQRRLMAFTSWSGATWVSRWLLAWALTNLEQQQLVEAEPWRGSSMARRHKQDNTGPL